MLFQQLQDENLDTQKRIDLASLLREFCNFSNTLQVVLIIYIRAVSICFIFLSRSFLFNYVILNYLKYAIRGSYTIASYDMSLYFLFQIQSRTSFLRSLANKRLFPTIETLLGASSNTQLIGGVQPHFSPWEKMGKHTFFHGQKWGWTPRPPPH